MIYLGFIIILTGVCRPFRSTVDDQGQFMSDKIKKEKGFIGVLLGLLLTCMKAV